MKRILALSPRFLYLKRKNMGMCLISIHATGSHHNKKNYDINVMAAQFVKELRKAGHSVTFATVNYGGEDIIVEHQSGYDLSSTDKYLESHEEKPL